jgi:hypothetical protein|tara:strand:+ start:901 stop:1122 length:222 start_codon:yes stop_codon:yes gene_type:complete
MKLKITKIELVEGSTIKPHWQSDMFRVNDIYLASTRDWDNTDGRYFDLQVGEIAEVTINEDNWIARSTKGLTQ